VLRKVSWKDINVDRLAKIEINRMLHQARAKGLKKIVWHTYVTRLNFSSAIAMIVTGFGYPSHALVIRDSAPVASIS
jgi:hypothetical protein